MTTISASAFTRNVSGLLGAYAQDSSGDVLYSGIHTLQRADYYFIGVNPHGPIQGCSIASTLETADDDNQYTSGKWGNYEPGCAPLQCRARELFRRIKGVEAPDDPIKDVLCSNLVFRRSPDAKGIQENDVNQCWKVHEYLLEIVQPRLIITHGNLPFHAVAHRLGLDESTEACAMWGSWKLRAARRHEPPSSSWKEQITLVGLPHLSWYSPWSTNKPERGEHVLRFIKEPFRERPIK